MLTAHDIIEAMAALILALAGWQLRSMAANLHAVELKLEKCVTFSELGGSLNTIHKELGEHGERLAKLEPR